MQRERLAVPSIQERGMRSFAGQRVYVTPLSTSEFLAYCVDSKQGSLAFVARGALKGELGTLYARAMQSDAGPVVCFAPGVDEGGEVPSCSALAAAFHRLDFETQLDTKPIGGNGPGDGAGTKDRELDAIASPSLGRSPGSLWGGSSASGRRAYVAPLSMSEFLAYGVSEAEGRVVFVARGSLKADIERFQARMMEEGASVVACFEPGKDGHGVDTACRLLKVALGHPGMETQLDKKPTGDNGDGSGGGIRSNEQQDTPAQDTTTAAS